MPWKIRISASAKTDIADIKKWYKRQSIAAVENFASEVTAFIDSLKRDEIEHKTVHAGFKRLLLDKFPYTIYYKRNDAASEVEIIAILHNRRDKSVIAKRLYE